MPPLSTNDAKYSRVRPVIEHPPKIRAVDGTRREAVTLAVRGISSAAIPGFCDGRASSAKTNGRVSGDAKAYGKAVMEPKHVAEQARVLHERQLPPDSGLIAALPTEVCMRSSRANFAVLQS